MNSEKNLTAISKFLSLVLRHHPEVVGVQLDDEGWLGINQLIANANERGNNVSLDLLHEVVATSDKKRFALSVDGLRIRAKQGHSVSDVDLKLDKVTPPQTLCHGTVAAFLGNIRATGLQKQSRNQVHLSTDEVTATKVGSRRGKPTILHVAAEVMHKDVHCLYLSDNGVWLVDAVQKQNLTLPEHGSD